MRQLTEKEAEDYLEKEGFNVVRRGIAKNAGDLMSIAKKVPFPWVMKVSSSKIVHKAKMGGIITDVQNIIQAEVMFREIAAVQGELGAMVQETLRGEEAIVGIKKTSEFGPVIMFGKGGRNVEADKDVSFRAVPITKQDAMNMVSETAFSKVLIKKKVDMDKIYTVLEKMSKLASKHKNITELDINPLFVNQDRAVVADARISFG